MNKLLLTTVAFTALFSGVAYADDASYPGAVERGTRGSPQVGTPDYPGIIERGNSRFGVGDDYFASGRATGRVPPAPDSTSVTTNSNGSSSVTQTWVTH